MTKQGAYVCLQANGTPAKDCKWRLILLYALQHTRGLNLRANLDKRVLQCNPILQVFKSKTDTNIHLFEGRETTSRAYFVDKEQHDTIMNVHRKQNPKESCPKWNWSFDFLYSPNQLPTNISYIWRRLYNHTNPPMSRIPSSYFTTSQPSQSNV